MSLDMVDGAGFRMFPSKTTPIGKGRNGSSAIYTVKDRESEIERHGRLQHGEMEGWTYIGQMHLNDALTAGEFTDEGFVAASAATTSLRVTAPRPEAEGAEGGAPDPVEAMALAIYDHLSIDGQGPGYDSERQLKSDIRSRGIAVSDNKWPDAVAWLVSRNLLKRWKVGSGYHGRIIPKTETDQPQPIRPLRVLRPNPTQS